MRSLVTFAVMPLLVVWTSPKDAGPSQAPATTVLLARDRTEPVVAVDPGNPSIVIAASNTNYDASVGDLLPTAYFASFDGGRTFRRGDVPMRRPFTTGADPSVAIARDGTVFLSYLGETPAFCSGGRSAVVLTHSIDHGRSFKTPVLADVDPADDKPFMAAESVPAGRSHIFLAWTRWHDQGSDIWFTHSTDGGAHFSGPRRLYTSRLDNFGPVPVVGPRGHVYVIWASFPERASAQVTPTRIMMRASTDDGLRFGARRDVSGPFASIPRLAQPGALRTLTGPGAAVDASGDVYVSWAQVWRTHADGSVDADIELARSTDSGRTWSRPLRVNDSRRRDRFMPALSAWSDGSVGVAFYDRRGRPDALNVYATRVVFAGRAQSSANRRIDHGSSPVSDVSYIAPGSTCLSPGRFFGDYIGAAATPKRTLCVVWADTELHVPSETDLWFSKRRL